MTPALFDQFLDQLDAACLPGGLESTFYKLIDHAPVLMMVQEIRRLRESAVCARDVIKRLGTELAAEQAKYAVADAHCNTQESIIDDLTKERDTYRDECLEQARLNGMGSEREAALLSKVERAEREIAALKKEMQYKWDAASVDERSRMTIACALTRIDAAEAVVAACMREMPFGNITTHVPENLAGRIADLAKRYSEASTEVEKVEKDRDALRVVIAAADALCNATRSWAGFYPQTSAYDHARASIVKEV